MTNKENFIKLINFDNPEKIISEIPEYCIDYLGCNHEGYNGEGHHLPVGSVWSDIWQTEWHKEHADVMGFPKGNPLCEVENLKNYKWPDYNDERICSQIYQKAKGFRNDDLFLSCLHRDTLWEKAYMLAGMENMMIYLYTEPEFAREVFHMIMDFQLGIAAHYISLGVEMVFLGDDLGTQNSLILSPDIINEFLVPEYKRIFDFYKKHNVIISFHSCGHIEPVLDTFMQLGVDILNPVQVTANDLVKVREKTLGKMTLCGGVSTKLIMDGTTKDIKDKVKETMKLLGKNGGYICTPDQGMPFPKENLDAFYKTVEQFGTYT